MPIDPYAALNAMLRAEVTRFSPPVRQTEPAASPKTTANATATSTATATAVEAESEPQRTAPADSAA
ncbi:hypothetical protein Snoj_71060 [Streptomyces nojiriensis]|uniref:Uncharacterized protein n=1 Tax=Streptomyces nojiriensis TaxID=66374 RepID=A0ABQ3SYG9_9ACTN|nr:hypothetical protein [Streptomyces nojiriensis]QTI46705.1 hypothetical protein JYK04_04543 [Streptomyces nojiriensis]GGS00766.1 hypothetical protein GCM10010205_31940 [Streptomyces nojiriensis]GHI73188.1 hypothetical protein Snoj_71060 [Streptomyces nojiriensis]